LEELEYWKIAPKRGHSSIKQNHFLYKAKRSQYLHFLFKAKRSQYLHFLYKANPRQSYSTTNIFFVHSEFKSLHHRDKAKFM